MLLAERRTVPAEGMPGHGIEQHFELVALLFSVRKLHDRHQSADVIAGPRFFTHALNGQVVGMLIHRAGRRPRLQGMLAWVCGAGTYSRISASRST